MFFEDRKDAGKKLAEVLQKLQIDSPIILGLPRGGVVVAAEVAKAFHARPDLLIVRKIGAPFNEELAIGALVEGEPQTLYLNHDLISVLKIAKEHIEAEKEKQRTEIARQQAAYRGSKHRENLTAKTVILVDDGIATGATVHAALKALRAEKPARLILAVPVAAPDALESLRGDAHDIVCLTSPDNFQAVGQFYRNFFDVGDDEVKNLLG